eukprot:497787_1
MSNTDIVDHQAFMRKKFLIKSGFHIDEQKIDYALLYKEIDKDLVDKITIKPITLSETNYAIISCSLKLPYDNENDNDNTNNANIFKPPNMSLSRSISIDINAQKQIFGQFFEDESTSKDFFHANINNKNNQDDVFESPPHKKPRIQNININNQNNINNVVNNQNDSNQIKSKYKHLLFIAELTESTNDNFESEIKKLECAGNINLSVNYQLRFKGVTTGNMILVDFINSDGQFEIMAVEIPLVQQLMSKPDIILKKCCKAIALKIGTHAHLNSQCTNLMFILVKGYLLPQINQAIEPLDIVTHPGGYNVIGSGGKCHRIIVYSNINKCIDYSARMVAHPWDCGIFLKIKADPGYPKLINEQVYEPLPNRIIKIFDEMYKLKGRMILSKLIAVNHIGLTTPKVFRSNGGVNPGIHMFSMRDQGKSFFLKLVAAAIGCPTIEGSGEVKLIRGNYTGASVQQNVSDMPGWIWMFEDSDRLTGNKANLPIIKLIWILSEINNSDTVASGDRKAATGGYVTTGNIDLSFLQDDATQSRIFVEQFDVSKILDENAMKIQSMIKLAADVERALAMRTEYIILKGTPSDKTFNVMCQLMNKLKNIVQNNFKHLNKYFSSRNVLYYSHQLARIVKSHTLLFGEEYREQIITEFVNSVRSYLDLCHDINTDPLKFSMPYSYDEYLRFFVFVRECSMINRDEIDKFVISLDPLLGKAQIESLTEMKKLIDLNINDLSVIMKDNWIGVNNEVKKLDGVISFNDLNKLCVCVIDYYKKYVEPNEIIDINMDENKNNDSDANSNDHEFLKNLTHVWNDKLLNTDIIVKGKFMTLVEFRIFLNLAKKNKKCICEKNYGTYRAFGNRYYAFETPDSLVAFYKSCKHTPKRSKKKKITKCIKKKRKKKYCT